MSKHNKGKPLNADQRRALTERLAKFKENQQKIRGVVAAPVVELPTAQEVTEPEPLEESFSPDAEAILFHCVNCQFQETHPSFESAITAHNTHGACQNAALVTPTPKYLKQQADKLAKKLNKPRYVHRQIETVVFE